MNPAPDPAVIVQVRLQLPDHWGQCSIKHWRAVAIPQLTIVVRPVVLSAWDMSQAPMFLDVEDKVYKLARCLRTPGRGMVAVPFFVYMERC